MPKSMESILILSIQYLHVAHCKWYAAEETLFISYLSSSTQTKVGREGRGTHPHRAWVEGSPLLVKSPFNVLKGQNSKKSIKGFYFKTEILGNGIPDLLYISSITSVYFKTKILLACKVNRLWYTEGLRITVWCQINPSYRPSLVLTEIWLQFSKTAPWLSNAFQHPEAEQVKCFFDLLLDYIYVRVCIYMEYLISHMLSSNNCKKAYTSFCFIHNFPECNLTLLMMSLSLSLALLMCLPTTPECWKSYVFHYFLSAEDISFSAWI